MTRRSGTTEDVMAPRRVITSGMLALCAMLPVSGLPAVAGPVRQDAMPFEVMTADDITRAGMRGTGCAWMTAGGRSIRFVASADRAVVKLRGAFRRLKPSRDAADMFPFTYDRWIGDGMTVRIVASGGLKPKVGEAPGATLEIVNGGRSSRHHGSLDCGT